MDPLQDIYLRAGRVIQRKRKEKGYKQDVLAHAADLTRTSISNIELGRQKLLLETFCLIARALGSSPGDLMDEVLSDSQGTIAPMKQSADPIEAYLLNKIIKVDGGVYGNKK